MIEILYIDDFDDLKVASFTNLAV